jgi:hypothetical protein
VRTSVWGKIDAQGAMAAMGGELQQVSGSHGGRLAIVEWVQVDGLMCEQNTVDGELHRTQGVVDQGQRSDGTGSNAEIVHEALARGKRKASAIDRRGERPEVDGAVFLAGE